MIREHQFQLNTRRRVNDLTKLTSPPASLRLRDSPVDVSRDTEFIPELAALDQHRAVPYSA